MKISILITSYNKSKYIRQCIESCLNQTYKNLEIIVIDNYSTDKTSKILNEYKSQIRIFYKKRISAHGTINQIDLISHGLKKSKGKIICLLDADDFFKKNKIIKIINSFRMNNHKVIFDLPFIVKKDKIKKFVLRKKIQKYIWPYIINTSCISIERNFLGKILKTYFFKKFFLLEIDFIINVISRNIDNNYKIINNYLSYYREVENSIMTNQKKYSKKWFYKRGQAHSYMRKVYDMNKKKYKNLIDKDITNLINKILN